MSESVSEHLEKLKRALLTLKPTGANGFEGLIGASLREIAGIPFRLASSGYQRGVDGKSVFEEDSICFEGKLYNDSIPRTDVITKISDLSRNGVRSDLVWVLGATSQVTAQLADDVRSDGKKAGISVLILDWAESDIPPLAVILAMGGKRVADFLEAHLEPGTHTAVLEAFAHIRKHSGFPMLEERFRRALDAPAMGTATAKAANAAWLTEIFSNRQRARDELGQPLAPGDTSSKIRIRNALIKQIEPFLTGRPDGTVACIHGGEGYGKSWAAIQSWMELEEKPLLVFLTPDDFHEIATRNDIDDLLISKLIAQTGDPRSEEHVQRWRSRLDRWRACAIPDTPRLVVLIDGVNQRPRHEWGKIVTKTSNAVHRLGGRVIVTVRTLYFLTRIKKALSVNCSEIAVPEWTPTEREEILNAHGVATNKLNPGVAQSLRNPRLLAIALEVFGADDVAAFEELSVSRLLFEYIRSGARDEYRTEPVDEFVGRLRKHANELLGRVKAKKEEDLNIFESDTPAVAGGHFFHSVEGEPGKYALKDNGLTLALGFALIESLRTAKRNGREPEAALDLLLEPIAALDDTADVILAALTVTAVDDKEYAPDLAVALVKGFAELQNPDEEKFPAFAGLAKTLTQDFMTAAHELCLVGAHQPNADWIEAALLEAGRTDAAWSLMTEELGRWLSAYSLVPERRMFSHAMRDPQEKVREEREKRQREIKERLESLSDGERVILDRMTEEDGDLNALSHLCFKLLAGKLLALFAESLVNWSLGQSLNPALHAPEKDFGHLVSLNCRDWTDTRLALCQAVKLLRQSDTSRTGKWALVRILRATGDSSDALEANDLVEELTKDRERLTSWRLLDKYCASDPCDPASLHPEDVKETGQRYRELDVGKLRLGMSLSLEDHFFIDARPAISRFAPDIAVPKHREFADNVLTRTGMPLRQGVLELRRHNALMTIDQAHALIERWEKGKTEESADGLPERDHWLVMQYHLLLAFPLLNPDECADILLSSKDDENILLDLMDVVSTPSELVFETLLKAALDDGSAYRQYLLLEIAMATDLPLSANLRAFIESLIDSESRRLRTSALGLIVHRGDDNLLAAVARSNWNAGNVDEQGEFERWYGSIALLKAATRGFARESDVLSRISPNLFGRAAMMLSAEAVRDIARRINISIGMAVRLENHLVAPDIEIPMTGRTHDDPTRLSVRERDLPAKSSIEAMERLLKSKEDFEERQRRSYESFVEFKDSLTRSKARIILDNLGLEEFKAIAAANDKLTAQWCDLFLAIPDAKLPAVHNLVLLLAHALSESASDKAEALFRRIKGSRPLVHFVFGSAGIDLDAMAVWAGTSTPMKNQLRTERLNAACNDHELALEVLTALKNGQQLFLEAYVEKKLQREEPAEVARGIMVAGFSDQNAFSDTVLARFVNSAGLTGNACEAAQYAYKRNKWSRHWFEKSCLADHPADFWCASMLLLRIIDGRFSIWRDEFDQQGAPIAAFGPSVESELKNRYEKWKNNRVKKLFGREAPDSVFLFSMTHWSRFRRMKG